MNFKNIKDIKDVKTLMLKATLVAIILALIVVGVLLLLKANNKINNSLEIDAPELIEDCWVIVDGKKASSAEIKVGKKIKLGYGSYPETNKDIEMIVSVDEQFSDIVSVKNNTVTGLSKGQATLHVAVLFPGKLGGKVTMVLPVKVYAKKGKSNKPASNQSSKPTSIFGDDFFDKIFSQSNSTSSKNTSSKKTSSKKTSSKKPSSISSQTTSLTSSEIISSTVSDTTTSNITSSKTSDTSPQVKTCDACGQTIINLFDHEVLECYNHYRCEPNVDEVSHDLAPCGDHQACDEGNHELRSCLSHFECDAEFSSLPCGHCACEHSAEETCE